MAVVTRKRPKLPARSKALAQREAGIGTLPARPALPARARFRPVPPEPIGRLHPVRDLKHIASGFVAEEAQHNQRMHQQLSDAAAYDKKYPMRWQERVSLGFWHPSRPTPQEFYKTLHAAKPKTTGLIEHGNIDLNHRPVVHNPDGSISTVRSITITDAGHAILIPTVVGGKVVSNDAAIHHYRKTGQHLGKFGSEHAANQYAELLHRQQAQRYVKPDASPAPRVEHKAGPPPAETPAMRATREREAARVQAETTARYPKKHRPFFDVKAGLRGGLEADKMVLGLSDKGGAPVQAAALLLPTGKIGGAAKIGRLGTRLAIKGARLALRHPVKTAAIGTVVAGEATNKLSARRTGKNLVRQAKDLPAAVGPALAGAGIAAAQDLSAIGRDTAYLASGGQVDHLEAPTHIYKQVVKPMAKDVAYLTTPGPVEIGFDDKGHKLYRSKTGGTTTNVDEAKRGMFAKFEERPLDYLLWARSAHLTGGRVVGRVGTKGMLGPQRRGLELPGRTELRTRTGTVATRRTSGNPVRRREQISSRARTVAATGAIEQRLNRELPVIGEHARARRALSREERRQQAFERDRVLRPFERSFQGLSGPEKIAVVLHAQGLKPSEELRFIEQQRALAKRNLNSARLAGKKDAAKMYQGERKDHKVMHGFISRVSDELYNSVATDPKLVRARAAASDLVNMSGDLLEQQGLLTPEARAMRPFLALRIARGARFQEVPYKVGHEPGKLLAGPRATAKATAQIGRISGLEQKIAKINAQHAAEKARTRPRTVDEAKSVLADLEAKHAQFEKAFYSRVIGDQPMNKADVARRNLERARWKKRKGRGKAIGSYSPDAVRRSEHASISHMPPTLTEEFQQLADAELHKFIQRHPDHPSVKKYLDEKKQIDSLRMGLADLEAAQKGTKLPSQMNPAEAEQHQFDQIFGAEPAPSFLEAAAKARETGPRIPKRVSSQTRGDLLGHVRVGAFGSPHHQLERLGAVGSFLKGEHQKEMTAWGRRQAPIAQEVKPVFEKRLELVGGPNVEGLMREGGDLFHFPHLGKHLKEGQIPLARSGAGPPAKPGVTKLNQGVRLLTSRWLPAPGGWRDGFLHAIAYTHARARGSLAFDLGLPLHADGSVRQGWYFVRQQDKAPARALRERGDLHAALEDYKKGKGIENWLDRNLVTREETTGRAWAENGDKVRQISPADYREIFGDFKGVNRFIRLAVDKPIDFWRAMTLTYRPAWVVNNIVGQTLLYALHHSGPQGIAAYAHAVMDEIAQAQGKQTPYFPEELRHGGFIMSEGVGGSADALSKARSLEAGVRDRIQAFNAAASDAVPRRAAFERITKDTNNLLNRVYKTSKTHEQFLKELEHAARPDAPSSDLKQLHNDLVQQVFDELIDFRNLSEFERTYIRRLIPFYSWIKGITQTTARLGLDHPARAELLAMLGQTQMNTSDKAFGGGAALLRNVLPLGKAVDRGRGQERDVLSTIGLNPLQTPGDVVRHLSSLVTNQEQGDNPFLVASPLVQTLIEAATKRELFSQKPLKGGRLQIAAGRALQSFPEVALAKGIATPLNPLKGSGEPRPTVPGVRYGGVPSELLRFVGVPVKRVNVPAHASIAEKQRLQRMSAPDRELEQVRQFRQDLIKTAQDAKLTDLFDPSSNGTKLEANTREAILWLARRNVARAQARGSKGSKLDALEKLQVDLKLAGDYGLVNQHDQDLIYKNASAPGANVGKMVEALGTYYFKRPALTYWRARLKALGKDVQVPSLYGG